MFGLLLDQAHRVNEKSFSLKSLLVTRELSDNDRFCDFCDPNEAVASCAELTMLPPLEVHNSFRGNGDSVKPIEFCFSACSWTVSL